MNARVDDLDDGFFRSSLSALVPYEPGKPIEEVQRELGLTRVVKLASNEGPYPPFPEALDVLARSARDHNRYPDGGTYRLRTALAARHRVRFEEVAVGAGSDGLIDCISQAILEPGDEVVLGWPSFPSYAIYAMKVGATPRRVPLVEHRYDLDGLLAAVGPATKLVYVCHPNNPTGTMNTRAEFDAYFERVPEHVLTVVDQAYFEYIEDPEYPDAIEEYVKRGRRAVALRTFSKIYGLAGLRVGYAVGPPGLVRAIGKTRRAFDVTSPAHDAAVASLAAPDHDIELERRRRVNAEGLAALEAVLREHGLDPVVPSLGNFLYVEAGEDTRPLFEALLREGVIVRPLHGFGAPEAIRVTVGTPDENAFFGDALGRVLEASPAGA